MTAIIIQLTVSDEDLEDVYRAIDQMQAELPEGTDVDIIEEPEYYP